MSPLTLNRKYNVMEMASVHTSVAKFSFLANFSSVELGPVVQSIVSLKSSLRGQFVKCFTTL